MIQASGRGEAIHDRAVSKRLEEVRGECASFVAEIVCPYQLDCTIHSVSLVRIRVCVLTWVLADGFTIKQPRNEQQNRWWQRLDVADPGIATNAPASDRCTGSHVSGGDATVDRYRRRVNARSRSVLDGRRFPGELLSRIVQASNI